MAPKSIFHRTTKWNLAVCSVLYSDCAIIKDSMNLCFVATFLSAENARLQIIFINDGLHGMKLYYFVTDLLTTTYCRCFVPSDLLINYNI